MRFVPNKKVYFTRVCRKIFFAKFSTKYSFICRCELVDSTGSMSCLIHRDMYDRHSASLALPGTVVFLKNVTVVKQSNGTLSGIVTPNNLVNIILLLQMPHSHCTRFLSSLLQGPSYDIKKLIVLSLERKNFKDNVSLFPFSMQNSTFYAPLKSCAKKVAALFVLFLHPLPT